MLIYIFLNYVSARTSNSGGFHRLHYNRDVESLVTYFYDTLAKAVTSYRDQLISLMKETTTADKTALKNGKGYLRC
jgi:hypothetical protein